MSSLWKQGNYYWPNLCKIYGEEFFTCIIFIVVDKYYITKLILLDQISCLRITFV